MSPQVKLTSRGLTIVTAGVAGSGPVDARHEYTTPRAPSEMVAWWMPGRRLLGRPPSGLSCGWKGTRTRRSRVVCGEVDRTALGAPNVAGRDRYRGAFSEPPRLRRTERGPWPRMPGVPLSIGVRIL